MNQRIVQMIGGPAIGALVNRIFGGSNHDEYALRESQILKRLSLIEELQKRSATPSEPPSVNPESLPEPSPAEETEADPGPSTEASGTSQLSAAGKACVPCSADHFSTVAGALGEAVRFARSEGIEHPEVQRRVDLSLDELNILERIDAAPELVEKLPEDEKALMRTAAATSRNIRHKLSDIHDLDTLEEATATAQESRTKFRRQLFKLQLGRMNTDEKKQVKQRTAKAIEDMLEES